MSSLSALYIVFPVMFILLLRKAETALGVWLQCRRARKRVQKSLGRTKPSASVQGMGDAVRTLVLCLIEYVMASLLTLLMFSVPLMRQHGFVVLWLSVVMVFIVRTLVQIVRLVRHRRYQPGVVVGVLALPVMVMFLRSFYGWYAAWEMLVALLVGCCGYYLLHRFFPRFGTAARASSKI